jgi:hypothetical protein
LRFLTFCESHCRPSKRPSPVVAQLAQGVSRGTDGRRETD